MLDKTANDYHKLANHFYHEKVTGNLTPRKLKIALESVAYNHGPAYFRRLKRAVSFDQKTKGYTKAAKMISEVKNPVTNKESGLNKLIKPKAKRKAVKKVSPEDFKKILAASNDKDDKSLSAALKIIYVVGCRSEEIDTIKFKGNNTIFVKSSKKYEAGGDRGLDRGIRLPAKVYLQMKSWMNDLKEEEPGKNGRHNKLRQRLDRLTKKLYPRRKNRITFLSFRHQKGSDLKASGLDRTEIAYLMGHQSTKSVDQYGDRRTGGKLPVQMRAAISHSEITKLVRENHREPYSARINTSALDLRLN